VFSKDTPQYGQLPQKTNVNLKLYKTDEGFFYWTFDILEDEDTPDNLFNTFESRNDANAPVQKKNVTKKKSTLAQLEAENT